VNNLVKTPTTKTSGTHRDKSEKSFVESPQRGEKYTAQEVFIGNEVIAENSDGNEVVRVIVTAPSPSDAPGPSNINLSNTSVLESSSVGVIIGNLTAVDGLGPFVFTITDDPDNKFSIDGNDLKLANTVDFVTANEHNVTIEVEDANNKTYEKTFLITVIEAIEAVNKRVKFNGIDEAIFNNNIVELNGVFNRSFTICFSVTKYRGNVEEKLSLVRTQQRIKEGCLLNLRLIIDFIFN
jgi:hypothetical protein